MLDLAVEIEIRESTVLFIRILSEIPCLGGFSAVNLLPDQVASLPHPRIESQPAV